MISCPRYIVALLSDIEAELDRIQWNINQEEYDSPFRNTGNEFINDVFEVRAYYWGDDEAKMRLPNFKCEDIEISWYKHLGRCTEINKRISRRKMEKLYLKCLISLEKMEHRNDNYLRALNEEVNEKEEFRYLKGFQSYAPSLFSRIKFWWRNRKES